MDWWLNLHLTSNDASDSCLHLCFNVSLEDILQLMKGNGISDVYCID